jgi:hypothetical protein
MRSLANGPATTPAPAHILVTHSAPSALCVPGSVHPEASRPGTLIASLSPTHRGRGATSLADVTSLIVPVELLA